jgi:tungstate transport system ATP-binding protein
MSLIEAKDIWQRRDGRDILKKINLSIERGEVMALIGPTGAGKTTLLRLIDLLDTPAEGNIFFDGIDTGASEGVRLDLRRRMGFVLQKPVVFNMSVFDNVAYGLKWRRLGRHQLREKVSDILETVGMAEYKDRNARTLSGGEMQRVAIARAMATRPEVLLLDEPSANLDPVSASNIEELIASVIKREKLTVIMATHDILLGQRLADKMCMLSNGEIVQSGEPGDIFFRPRSIQIAEFVGMENVIEGVITACEGKLAIIDASGKIIEAVTELDVGEKVSVCLRPEDITVALARLSSSARNSLGGTVVRAVSSGPFCRIEIDCGFPLVALVTRRSAEEMGLEKGKQVYATFKAVSTHVIRR